MTWCFSASIDGSHAELDNPRRIDHRHLIAQPRQAPGTMTSNNGDRHAVNVAGRRGVRGVEVGVGVQPEDREGPLHCRTVARDRSDRPDRERVIAAEQDRQKPTSQRIIDRVADGLTPDGRFLEVPVAVDWRCVRIDRADDVAAILDRAAQTPQGCLDSGHAKGFRPHRAAAVAGADVRRRTDQRDGRVCASRLPGHLFAHVRRDTAV
jgi:hypothetical protein